MRVVSCNGCRVLRKGCGEDCSIKSCLDWIKSPESQGNATMFLAKFYGRTGLINLIDAGPLHLRPAIFRSLLHEACGRILNPIYGSVGLLWSGSWQLCQAAVDSVLNGEPITPITTDTAENGQSPPIKIPDIRHIPKPKDANFNGSRPRKPYKPRRSKRTLLVESEELELKLGIEPVGSSVNDIVVPLKKRKMGVFRTCQVEEEDICEED